MVSRADALVGIAGTASEGVVGRDDLAQRPLQRPGELLETIPGFVATQHSGGGKANQYYLRGFNLDHGTDFRITVAGVPVNLASHAHGQGYADLSFLIPELVDTVRFSKGPWSAADGEFATAGAVRLDYVDTLDGALVEVAGGELGYRRVLVADAIAWREGTLLGGLEVAGADGPWQLRENLERGNGLLRYSSGDANRGLNVTWTGYHGAWNATGQVPSSLVDSGALDRFASLDPTTGGNSYRTSLALALNRNDGERSRKAELWALGYGLDLFSNFTYFLDDPERGDQFEQRDRRVGVGGTLRQAAPASLFGHSSRWTVGLDARAESIDNGLYRTTARVRHATTREDEIEQVVVGLWSELETRWSDHLRTVIGLRADGWSADVTSSDARNSGRVDDTMVSPKLGLVLGPWQATEVYVHVGSGFHSNDARGATIRVDPTSGEPVDRVEPLVRARAAEVGVRTEVIPKVRTSLSLFSLDLDSELLYIGDAGGTEASRPSRRVGVELANSWLPRPWLRLELDLAASRPRFRDNDPSGDRIPGAVEHVASANILVEELGRFSGGLRIRHVGPRDLIEDASQRSPATTLVHLRLGWRLLPELDLVAEVYNLLDETASDIEYFYTSRPNPTGAPIDDVHFHPTEPRALRLAVEWHPR